MDNKIKEIIEKSHMQINTIIEAAGIGKTSFYAIMNGTQTPKITTAKKIADALVRPISDVFPSLNEKVG